MGKIVRGAKVAGRAYIVAVPEAVLEPVRANSKELDERFASPDGRPVSPDALASGDPQAFLGASGDDTGALEPRIDWERVRADAQALIDAAAADAEAMLQDAAARSREITVRAQANAVEVEAGARARGHDEGLASGLAAAQEQSAQALAEIRELVESVRAQRHTVIESAEPEVVRVVMAVAERVVHEQIAIDPNVVIENVRHALTRLIGREVVTLRVNPADMETIRLHRDGIAASNDVEHLRVIEDQRVDRGGVIVETDAGTIDAKVSTQLREARRALQTADAIGEPALLHAPAQAS